MADMTKRQDRLVQLNEKVSDTQYDVLHPETIADQVITNNDKQFVSQTQINKWDSIASTGLTFLGNWNNTTSYSLNNVVQYNGKYYIYINETAGTNRVPSDSADTAYWANINLEAYTATNADKIATSEATNNVAFHITFVDGNNATANYEALRTSAKMSYNPSQDIFYVGNITASGTIIANKFEGKIDASNVEGAVGKAEVAEKYVAYDRDEDGNLVNGVRTQVETPYIDDTLSELKEELEIIKGGGTTLSKKLTITKDGANPVEFDGSTNVTVDIQQTFSTEEISDLLDTNKKIQEKWLPDTVLGQLEYQGVWDPSNASSSSTPKAGYYYIANNNGNYSPDGTLEAASASTTPQHYLTGDWAVFNGTSWDKIDNTDAVTMVNSQIGAVETYKGSWNPLTQYYRGDIVKHENVLYICHTSHQSATSFADTNWELFGRTYTGSDAIKVEGSVIKHDVTLEDSVTTDVTLVADQTFNLPVLTRDAFGHVTKIDVRRIKLGSDFVDTTREIQLNGSTILAGTGVNKNKILNFSGSEWIKLSYENDSLNFAHKNSALGAFDFTSEAIDGSTTADDILYPGQGYAVPSFKVDGAGHIISGKLKKFRIASALVKHSHFNITTDSNGAQVIGAYDAATATQDWVNLNSSRNKFFLGDAIPTGDLKMSFNGIFNATKLLNKGKDVLDNSLGFYGGLDFNGREILGTYNTTKNRIEMGVSGVAAGVYSAVNVNEQGLVTAGGQIIEFGAIIGADPSAALAVGGLFFRKLA